MTDTAETGRRIKPFDFQQQEALDRGRLRRLQPVLEVLAHRVAGALTSTLRIPVHVAIGELEQLRWEHYTNDLPEPTFLASATVTPLGGRIVLHMPIHMAMSIIEIRLGGTGSSTAPERPLSEIEQRLVAEVAQAALAEFPPAFAPFMTLGVGAITTVASSLFLHAATPTEACLVIQLNIEVGDDTHHQCTLCLPLSILLPILDALERMDKANIASNEDSGAVDVRARLFEAPLEVSVQFRELWLSPEELCSLGSGDVIGFHSDPKAPLLLTVSGIPFCEVVPTVQGRRLACMVIDDKEATPQ
jgi:flagellar motor switch protein FliM